MILSINSRALLAVSRRRLGCFYSTQPPRNSYISSSTPLQLWWYNKFPLTAKYFGAVGLTAYTLTHIGHETMFTVGPPLLVAGYFGHKWYHQRLWKAETGKIVGKDVDVVRIRSYDESEVDNVLQGLDNQFDHFKRQIIEVVETKIVDFVSSESESDAGKLFINGDQIRVNVDENELETFVVLKIAPKDLKEVYSTDLVDFIKLSLPFYSSKNTREKKRLGIIQVYLLQNAQDDPLFQEYNMDIEIIPTRLFAPKSITLDKIYNDKIVKSKMLKDYEGGKSKKE